MYKNIFLHTKNETIIVKVWVLQLFNIQIINLNNCLSNI